MDLMQAETMGEVAPIGKDIANSKTVLNNGAAKLKFGMNDILHRQFEAAENSLRSQMEAIGIGNQNASEGEPHGIDAVMGGPPCPLLLVKMCSLQVME